MALPPRSLISLCLLLLTTLAACASKPSASQHAVLTQQVFAAERAFARSMADRDHAAFSQFLADDAAFFTGAAPFSWQPEQVEVQADGQLALSTGPVFDPSGKLIARFTSIWQQQAPGVWRVVFDRGNPACPPAAMP